MTNVRTLIRVAVLLMAGLLGSLPHGAEAIGPAGVLQEGLVPHKALYDIDLVSTRSGSQILNISGSMFYEWKPSCDAWVTGHRFNLDYEYADSPGMQVASDFSTYENFDGKSFDFTSRRWRDGKIYEELRGKASLEKAGRDGEVLFSKPEGLIYDLPAGTVFPMGHTRELVKQARKGTKFYKAVVFDGSDDEGPVEINSFIGKQADPAKVSETKEIEAGLVRTPAWDVRMAVFPLSSPSEQADYEMSMVFHENGVISDMLIEYDDFSVTQKLVALQAVEPATCNKNKDKKKD